MKKVLLVLMISVFALGCSKDDAKPRLGSVEVKISYFYNTAQGYKPDVGASVYLFKQSENEYEQSIVDYKVGILTIKDTETSVRYDYSAEADVSGTATLTNVPYGKYRLAVSSKGRWTYSVKAIEVNSESQSHVKNFGYLSEYKPEGEAW